MATLGGIYRFSCDSKLECPVFEKYASGDALHTDCPSCGGQASRIVEGQKHAAMDYDQPILSTTLGVNPSQIPEALKKFPHHEYAPDGRMIIRNHYERKKIMKELGFFDKDGY